MADGYGYYQNAFTERKNGILKQEFLFNKAKNKEELNQLEMESIYHCNNKRHHLSLKMETPEQVHKKSEEKYSSGLN
ncbi:hypothetical protein CHRY9393_03378 [Chryseobacterium fistulae]|uniref:Integrase catalytic domain-containing protein n=2 Tax=Chryseobacterium fistulae TaxID=2675058 RepID=A0A6N4XWM5_9FLAO|nr:hypothetical protein CHRY9393_03378 [Chryseobacterium fistulae]